MSHTLTLSVSYGRGLGISRRNYGCYLQKIRENIQGTKGFLIVIHHANRVLQWSLGGNRGTPPGNKTTWELLCYCRIINNFELRLLLFSEYFSV